MRPVFLASVEKFTLLNSKYKPRKKERFTNEIMVYSKFLTFKFYLHVDISYLIIIKVLIPTMQIFNLKIQKTFEKNISKDTHI